MFTLCFLKSFCVILIHGRRAMRPTGRHGGVGRHDMAGHGRHGGRKFEGVARGGTARPGRPDGTARGTPTVGP